MGSEEKIGHARGHGHGHERGREEENSRPSFFRARARVRARSFLFLFFLLLCNVMSAVDRSSSAPFVSGDTFRAFCDHVYDETGNFRPQLIKSHETIFVKGDYLHPFFKRMHPLIKNPYILVTHNSDDSAPGIYKHYLDGDKIVAWFAQNPDSTHPKLYPIPMGLANRYWPHGNVDAMQKMLGLNSAKKHLAYLNITVKTYTSERSLVYNLFEKKPFCYSPGPKNYEDYLKDLAESKFVFSPRGNALDTHRLWEALYLGAYPIVKSSSLDPLYHDLPIVIVHDWNEVTEEFLHQKQLEFSMLTFFHEKLHADYWFNLINEHKI